MHIALIERLVLVLQGKALGDEQIHFCMSLSSFNAREKFGEITGNVIGVQLASEKLHEGSV